VKQQIVYLVLLFLTTALPAFSQEDYLERGNSFLNSGKLEEAEQTLRDGIKSEPDNLIYQCQLGLTLVQQKKYTKAEEVLDKVLKNDSENVAAIWYSGIGNFQVGQDRQAIARFEEALTFLDETRGQYYSANWYIGKSYSNLLKTEGLTYEETDRMFECFEEYLRLQPNAKDAVEVREYVERKKTRRPPNNVKNWVDL